MLLAVLATVIGLVFLVYSADYFIDGASAAAVKFGMPKFLIGMLILGIGTSAPEIVVSVLSALSGSAGLALGNAYGSNIVNITLVLGATALISPLFIQQKLVKGDFLLLLGVTALTVVLLLDKTISFTDGVILCVLLAAILILQMYFAKKGGHEATDELIQSDAVNVPKSIAKLVGGLAVLVISSRFIVWGAVEIAKSFGMSEIIIGLTIVAVGTSLPELISSVMAARKGEDEMALGNVIGSNIFNTLAVVGVAGLIAPISVADEILKRDIVVMSGVTLVLFVMCLMALAGSTKKLGRLSGGILMATFVAYTAYLAMSVMA
ncbi:MAG: calcium/sodium antiporter [Moraxella sp.]|uniref:calcium/sodium antiporter n=1 Tax=Moraxella sp. TaxID=479 RepID=UPI0026DD6ECB|nr:calcium/sodium antiporter [Moraxella sp.]MDO4450640.1 calcium/sodium antiporter [Moraxella sp.]